MRLPALLLLTMLLAVGCGSHAPVQPPPTTAAARPHPHPRRPVAKPQALALPSPLPHRKLDLPILMYHRIDVVRPTLPAITQRLTVDPRQFAAEMEWLSSHGYHAVTQLQVFDALERGRPLPPEPVLITFDDGYRDVLWKAAPILKRLHMPATAYVITDRPTGGDPSFLTWPLVRLLARQGFDIGSHTVTHANLPALAPSQLASELVDSRRALQQELGRPVQWLAYPDGRYDSQVVAAARAAGYVLAVTTQPGSRQDASQPLLLHRYEVLDSTGVDGMAALLGR